jgi:AraC-like DNA-binding protein
MEACQELAVHAVHFGSLSHHNVVTAGPAASPLIHNRQSLRQCCQMEIDVSADGGVHRVGVLAEVPAAILQCGGDPGPVLAKAGIDPELLRNPENRLPFPAVGRLLAEAAVATDCPHFGLIVGSRGGLGSLGLIGRLMATASTVREAILDLCINQVRYIRGAVTYLRVQEGVAVWGYALQRPRIEGFAQWMDAAVMIGVRMLQELADVSPNDVLLSHGAPKDPAPYRAAFGITPHFDAEQCCVVIAHKMLTAPVRTADPELRKLLLRQTSAYWALAQPGFAEQVSRVMFGTLLSGGVWRDAVAEVLELSARTLNRKLQAEGTTFRTLVDAVRHDLACQLLGATLMPVTEISGALGYAGPAAFARAFRRVSGQAPSEWRRKQAAE